MAIIFKKPPLPTSSETELLDAKEINSDVKDIIEREILTAINAMWIMYLCP